MFRFSADDSAPSSGAADATAADDFMGLQLVPLPTAVPQMNFNPGTGIDGGGSGSLQLVPLPLPAVPKPGDSSANGEQPKQQKKKQKDGVQKKRKKDATDTTVQQRKLRKGITKKKKSKSKREKRSKAKAKAKPKSTGGTQRTAKGRSEQCANDLLQETSLVESFKWPQHLLGKIFSMLQYKEKDHKHLHIQVFSEFSGAGTAELALQAIAGTEPETHLQTLLLLVELFEYYDLIDSLLIMAYHMCCQSLG